MPKVATPSISIRNASRSSLRETQETANSTTEAETAETATFEDLPFAPRQLQQAWRKYTQNIPQKAHLANTMLACELKMISDTVFEVAVENSFQEKELTDEKSQILAFLTKELQNSAINFSAKITEFVREKVLTDSEQLDEMSRKNPAFARLRNELKLDVY